MSLRYIGGLVSPSVNPLAANVTTSPNVAQYNGSFTLQQQAQAITSGQWATDPYYKNTTLLLHADGKANGSQNNTFLDSSASPFTITRNGNTTQGSFSPYGPTWSNYFDGSGDGVSIPDNAAIEIGASSFCVEGWIFPTSTSGTQCVFYKGASGVSTGYAPLNISFAGTALTCYSSSNGSSWNVLSNQTIGTLTTNAWNHFVVCRSGSDWGFFLNGVRNSTASSSATLLDNSAAYSIGRSPGYSEDYNGYISNVRLVIGSSVYTPTQTSLIVPTVPLTNITNTAFLTCQSNRFIDNGTANSGSGFTVTVNGNTAVQRFSPFAPQYQYTPAVIGGSGYFDGSGDFLSLTGSSATNFNGTDWTIENWVYLNGAPTNNLNTIQSTAGTNNWIPYLAIGFKSSYEIYACINAAEYQSTQKVQPYTWNHIAMVRSGGVVKVYLNGVATSISVTSDIVSSNLSFYFGKADNTPGGGSAYAFLNGYQTDARFARSALYTSAFTPPTAPLTAVTNTSLLLNCTNAGIYDNAMMNNLETVGNAQVSTSVVKYGSGSLYFDGSGDYLISPNTLNGDLSTGDFTIEYWFNCGTQSTSYLTQVGTLSSASPSKTWRFGTQLGAAAGVYFAYHNGTTFVDVTFTTTNYNNSTWHHAALTRSSGTVRAFIDGVQVGSNQTITQDLSSGQKVCVGAELFTPTYYTGYLDDVRITKGVARYTSNFIPPKVAMANQ